MRDPDDHAVRRALLAEIEAHRREHPQLLAYFIAKAIHAAGLGASATAEDLDDARLHTVVAMTCEHLAGAGSS